MDISFTTTVKPFTRHELEAMLAKFIKVKEYDVHRIIGLLIYLELIDESGFKSEEVSHL